MNRLTTRDDRGQKVQVRAHGMGDALRFGREERVVIKAYERLVNAREAAHPVQIGAVLLVEWAIAGLLAVVTFRQATSGMYANALTISMFVVAGGVLVASAVSPFLTLGRLRRLERRRGQLPRLCAQCLYSLAGLPAERDGCTICPECGAAWRFDPGSGD